MLDEKIDFHSVGEAFETQSLRLWVYRVNDSNYVIEVKVARLGMSEYACIFLHRIIFNFEPKIEWSNAYTFAEEMHGALGTESNGKKTWRILLSLREAMSVVFFFVSVSVYTLKRKLLTQNEREKYT